MRSPIVKSPRGTLLQTILRVRAVAAHGDDGARDLGDEHDRERHGDRGERPAHRSR
jgi:hypothetical protein